MTTLLCYRKHTSDTLRVTWNKVFLAVVADCVNNKRSFFFIYDPLVIQGYREAGSDVWLSLDNQISITIDKMVTVQLRYVAARDAHFTWRAPECETDSAFPSPII